MVNQSSTSPLDLLLCDLMKSAGLYDGRNGDQLPLADLGGSQHFLSESKFKYCNYLFLRNNLESLQSPVFWVTPFMLCTNSIITSFVGDMFSLSYDSKKYHAASVPPSSRSQL